MLVEDMDYLFENLGQIVEVNDKYGDVLHTYTIKNALDDGSVLGFQVEHEDTIENTSEQSQFQILEESSTARNLINIRRKTQMQNH